MHFLMDAVAFLAVIVLTVSLQASLARGGLKG
jgi:hypothetical protein